ncbi:hypothetical protein I4U23_027491 [Adineta vaga]|nr:hypothetical protein I4U23_027491 [Adineta vaga]
MALTIPSPADNVIENEPQINQVDAMKDTNISVESVKTRRLHFFIKFLLGSLILLFAWSGESQIVTSFQILYVKIFKISYSN